MTTQINMKKLATLLVPTIIAFALVALFFLNTKSDPISTNNTGQIYRGQENLVLSNKLSKKMIFENNEKWDEIGIISFEVGKSYGGNTGIVHWSVTATATLKSGEVRTANIMTDFKPTVEKITHDSTTKEWKVYTNGDEIEKTIEKAVSEAYSIAIDGMTRTKEKSREEIAKERRAEWYSESEKLTGLSSK